MKKRILFLLLLLQTTLMASAYDIKVDGLCYNYTSDSTVAVTYVNFPNNDLYVKGDLVIPATIIYEGKKYAVTSIGKNAFYFCQFLMKQRHEAKEILRVDVLQGNIRISGEARVIGVLSVIPQHEHIIFGNDVRRDPGLGAVLLHQVRLVELNAIDEDFSIFKGDGVPRKADDALDDEALALAHLAVGHDIASLRKRISDQIRQTQADRNGSCADRRLHRAAGNTVGVQYERHDRHRNTKDQEIVDHVLYDLLSG